MYLTWKHMHYLWSGIERTGGYLQMNRLSLRNNRLKFKTAGKLPIGLEESIEYTPIYWRETGGCQHVTGWTCKHSDLNRWCPKITVHYIFQSSLEINCTCTNWLHGRGHMKMCKAGCIPIVLSSPFQMWLERTSLTPITPYLPIWLRWQYVLWDSIYS